MESRIKEILLWIVGIIAYLALPILLSPDLSSDLHFIHVKPFQRDFIFHVFLLLFILLNYFYLIPHFYYNKNKLYYFVIVVLSYIVINLLCNFIISFLPHVNRGPNEFGFGPPPHLEFERRPPMPMNMIHLFKNVLWFALATLFCLFLTINKRLKDTQSAKIKTELDYLRAQINPHFLFNTLNTIYSLAIVGSAKTADSIVKLSNMMRYVLVDSNAKWVSMEDEVNYLNTYIDLQKLRFNKNVSIEFNKDCTKTGILIPPMLFIPFIENSFKYGVSNEAYSEITITLTCDEKYIYFFVGNKKLNKLRIHDESTGIGINNTRTRLELLYPNKHKLDIVEENNEFKVYLKINYND